MMTNRTYPSRPAAGGRDSGPSYDQVLKEVRNAGMISTHTFVEVPPTAQNEYLCVIRAEVIMPSLRENDSNRHYSGLGAAYPRKNGANVIHGVSNPSFYIHIAESRAKKRAWMDALGRGDGLEESIREEVFVERANVTRDRSSTQDAEYRVALPVAASPVWRIREDIARRISTFSGISEQDAMNLTREEAEQHVQKIREHLASQNSSET